MESASMSAIPGIGTEIPSAGMARSEAIWCIVPGRFRSGHGAVPKGIDEINPVTNLIVFLDLDLDP